MRRGSGEVPEGCGKRRRHCSRRVVAPVCGLARIVTAHCGRVVLALSARMCVRIGCAHCRCALSARIVGAHCRHARSSAEQPGAAQRRNEQPGAARSSQPGAARSSHEQTRAAKSSQEQPGAAMSSQEQRSAAKSKLEQLRCVVRTWDAVRAPRPGIRRGLRDHKGHDHDTDRHPNGNACWDANMHSGCGQPGQLTTTKSGQEQPRAAKRSQAQLSAHEHLHFYRQRRFVHTSIVLLHC